jgi:hypothetical protein
MVMDMRGISKLEEYECRRQLHNSKRFDHLAVSETLRDAGVRAKSWQWAFIAGPFALW